VVRAGRREIYHLEPVGIRPYAETSAGFARTSLHLNGAGFTNVLSNFGLQFLDRTDPIASAGGGVTFESGHLVADIGYRYRRMFSSDWMSALALGDTLHFERSPIRSRRQVLTPLCVVRTATFCYKTDGRLFSFLHP
jgi:hypothetical protein